MKMKYVDLFSGIGGFRLAIDQIDDLGISFEAVAAADIDPWCRKFYSSAFGPQETLLSDVKEIAVHDPIEGSQGAVRLPNFDLLLGGFPCQPFANIGLRGGLDDPRGELIYTVVKVLRTYRPTFFVLENVQKLRNLGKGAALQTIVDALQDAGYHVYLWDLCASDYGVPQKRRRFFFCGVRADTFSRKDIPAPSPIAASERRYPSTWHLLERKMEGRHMVPVKTRETVLRKNPRWEGDLDINLAVARPLTASMSKWHRANQDNYFSEAYVFSDSPPVSRSGGPAKEHEAIRRITPLEGLRLQGFPDWYEDVRQDLSISFSTSYRLIGNAVPVSLAANVTRSFLAAFV